MQQQHNLVQVKELTKGVESIVEVDWKNQRWVEPCLIFFFFFWFRFSSACFTHLTLLVSLWIAKTFFRLRSFSVPEEAGVGETTVLSGEGETPYHPPEITTLYSVSARLEPLFLDANKRCVCVCVHFEVSSPPAPHSGSCLHGSGSRWLSQQELEPVFTLRRYCSTAAGTVSRVCLNWPYPLISLVKG